MDLTINEFERMLVATLKQSNKPLEFIASDGSRIRATLNETGNRSAKAEVILKFTPTVNPLQSLDEQIQNALRTYHERNKFSFIALSRFKRELPFYGIDLPERELEAVITQMVAEGKLILDKLPQEGKDYMTTAVRTPEMPMSENWRKEPRATGGGSR